MSISVFLVDDHAVVREGLRFLLGAQADIKVIGLASNGREAVDQMEQLQPDVVIMDIAMPELNGIEATQRLKTECPGCQVIILSMHSSNEQIFRALQAGARGYLLKETAGLEIATAVRTVHAGRRYLSTEVSDQLVDEYMQQRALDEVKSPLTRLSPREREILQLVVEGQTSIDIAVAMSISPRSVETYRRRLMQKLGIATVPALVKFAINHGLTRLE